MICVDPENEKLSPTDIDALLASVPGLTGTGELLDRLCFGFLVGDTRSRLILANDTACRLLGVPRSALLGAPPRFFLEPDAARFEQQRGQRASGQAEPYCVNTRRADGTLHRVRIVPQVLRNREGVIIGSSGTFTPVDKDGRVISVSSQERARYLEALERGQV
jgi:PAS domain S-box-containing protein